MTLKRQSRSTKCFGFCFASDQRLGEDSSPESVDMVHMLLPMPNVLEFKSICDLK